MYCKLVIVLPSCNIARLNVNVVTQIYSSNNSKGYKLSLMS